MLKSLWILLVSIVLTTGIAIFGCSDSENPTGGLTGPENNTVSGTVTFVQSDSNLIITDTTAGYYSINLFASWPPVGNATSTLKIKPAKQPDNTYKASYKFSGVNNGSYAVTTAFVRFPYVPGNSVLGLGILGCDTSHNPVCIFSTSIQKATVADNKGVENINFLSWADTTKRIYKF